MGLNKSKPPSLINLYKFINNYQNQINHNHQNRQSIDKDIKNKEKIVQCEDFSHYVNLDAHLIDSQIEEMEKLNEKQKYLLNKIDQLQIEIDNLNTEREIFIKKIDNL